MVDIAIIIILRLRRPSELLSLTVYDERGVPIHHQGDFRLEELVLSLFLLPFEVLPGITGCIILSCRPDQQSISCVRGV